MRLKQRSNLITMTADAIANSVGPVDNKTIYDVALEIAQTRGNPYWAWWIEICLTDSDWESFCSQVVKRVNDRKSRTIETGKTVKSYTDPKTGIEYQYIYSDRTGKLLVGVMRWELADGSVATAAGYRDGSWFSSNGESGRPDADRTIYAAMEQAYRSMIASENS